MKLQVSLYCIILTSISFAQQEFSSLPFTSQNGQDYYVLTNFFKKADGTFIDDGFFVEIGAYDGKLYSNTFVLEKLGWKGMCVEPIPTIFAKLAQNRSCICIQGCVAAQEGTAPFREVCNDYNAGPADFLLSGLAEKYNPQHVNLIENHYSASSNYYEVPCFRLSQILQEYEVEKIDFLSIDTEGNELEILQSLSDEELERINIICVEDNYGNRTLVKFLEQKNFKLVGRIHQDLIFRNLKYCN